MLLENSGMENLAVYTETVTQNGPNIFTFKFMVPESVAPYKAAAGDVTQKVGRIFFEFPTRDYDGSTAVFTNSDFVYTFTETQDNYGELGCWVNSELRDDDIPIRCRVVPSENEAGGAPIIVELLNFVGLSTANLYEVKIAKIRNPASTSIFSIDLGVRI